jgi:hypothetical protein
VMMTSLLVSEMRTSSFRQMARQGCYVVNSYSFIFRQRVTVLM